MNKSLKTLAAILVLMACSLAESAQEMSHDQIQKLKGLELCLKSLPESGGVPADSTCAEAPVNTLHGVYSENILRSLGKPNWCKKAQEAYIPWTEQDCGGTQEWGYSFYYLPSSYLGGGSDLQFTFDGNNFVKKVNWITTEKAMHLISY